MLMESCMKVAGRFLQITTMITDKAPINVHCTIDFVTHIPAHQQNSPRLSVAKGLFRNGAALTPRECLQLVPVTPALGNHITIVTPAQ